MITLDNVLDVANKDLFAINYIINQVPGVKHLGRHIINFDDILIIPLGNNVRKGGSDDGNVQELYMDFANSVRINQCLPVVEKLKTGISRDGKIYWYRLTDGYNRSAALKLLNMKQYWFDIVSFPEGTNYDYAKTTFALLSNDHPPKKKATNEDIHYAAVNLVNSGGLANDRDQIKTWIRKTTSSNEKRAGNIANKVLASLGSSEAVYVWSQDMVRDRVVDFGVTSYGEYDFNTGKCGFTSKEGYEADAIMNAIAKLYETTTNPMFNDPKTSLIYAHTNLPTGKKTLNDHRNSIKSTYSLWEERMNVLIEYKNKTGQYPWELKGFLPQTQEEMDTKTIVPLK